MIHLDFETYSEVDLIKVGAYRYAEDPSTEILCAMWHDTRTGADHEWYPGDPVPYWFYDDSEIHAWNVFFEACIIKLVGQRYGFPDIALERYRDSMALAAYFGLPLDLFRASAVVGGEKKDKRGGYLISVLCKPVKPTKARPWTRLTPENCPDLFEEFYEYCRQDVRAEMAVHDFLPRQQLPEMEQAIWYDNFMASFRGVQLDRQLIEAMIRLRDEHIAGLEARFFELTGLYPTQRDKVREYLALELGIFLEDLKAETLRLLLLEDHLPEEARELIEIRQSVSKTSVKKLDAMLACMSADDRVHGMMVYYGTHTGRNAGRLVQVLNLPKGVFKALEIYHTLVREGLSLGTLEMLLGEPMEALSTLIRGCLTATPGRYLYLADYASIEARVVAWMAGQEDLLEQFRQGLDPYVAMAAKIYGTTEAHVTKAMRALGKTAVLGCQYQMGQDRFYDTCIEWGSPVERELSDRAVDVYRESNREIVRYWYEANNTVQAAIRNPDQVYRVGPVIVASTGRYLYCKLPSGRTITYPMPQILKKRKNFPRIIQVEQEDGTVIEVKQDFYKMMDVTTYMGIHPENKQWCRLETYGGKLTENWTQGIARDIMAEAQLRTEQQGFDYLFSVYDEIVSECDEPDRLEEYIEEMTRMPEWALGLPIAAEGEVVQRFKK